MEMLENQEELEEFLYIVSHDLKAPIISIQGYVNLLTERHGARLSPEIKRYLDRIQVNSHRLEDMVNGLVELSRIGRTDTQRELIDLSSIISDLFSQYSSRIEERQGKFNFQKDLPGFLANRERIYQLFGILLDNTLRFSDRVEIDIIEEPAGEPEKIGICYFDPGARIPKERLEEIFKLFYNTKDIKGYNSIGLGLTQARRILEKHGGGIWAEALDLSGVKFHMSFSKEGG